MKREDPALQVIQQELGTPAPVVERAPSPPWWPSLKEDVACVLARDPAARNRFEVWTIYPGVQAVAFYRMAHALWQRGWRFLPRWLSFVARWMTNVDIHPGARIGRRFFIDHGAGVVIGETAEVGNDVTLYHGVTLGGTTWRPGKRHPTLGDGVVVGAGAKILGAITVGDRARVAANSVVIDHVPEAATVVGIPGRVVVRHRDPDASSTTAANLARAHGLPIDLDHHLIPDPVGKAMACLLERIHTMECGLRELKGIHAPEADANACLPAEHPSSHCEQCGARS
jgi:serine O-acetyltransferase